MGLMTCLHDLKAVPSLSQQLLTALVTLGRGFVDILFFV